MERERPDVCSQRASQTRFSRDCKNVTLEEEANPDRTVRPVVCSKRAHQFVIEDDETESELSLGSRSFLHRVNDQVRKRQKRSSVNVTENDEKHSMMWGMFMSVTLESAVFTGKNYLDNCHYITNTRGLTLKQMFDISARLVSEQDEISGVETIGSGKSFMEISVFSDSVSW